MLEALQSAGTKPPLLLVHGQYGVSTIGEAVVAAVGADQPVHLLHARGIAGAGEACATVKALVADHLAALRVLKFDGPLLLGGIGSGSFVAIEMARELMLVGRPVGPVLMIDPGPVPYRSAAQLKALEPVLGGAALRRQLHDQAAAMFRRWQADKVKLPFDAADPVQLERAAGAAAATSLALARHRAAPFYGPVELILCRRWARNFFVPRHDWQKVLPGRRTFHVLEGDHRTLLTENLEQVAQLVAVYLEAALDPAQPAGDRVSPPEEMLPDLD